jgi:hypothetical protein
VFRVLQIRSLLPRELCDGGKGEILQCDLFTPPSFPPGVFPARSTQVAAFSSHYASFSSEWVKSKSLHSSLQLQSVSRHRVLAQNAQSAKCRSYWDPCDMTLRITSRGNTSIGSLRNVVL